MGRIIAVDYGKKRTGLAWTDLLQITSSTFASIETKDLLKQLAELIKKEGVTEIVFGLPLHPDGSKMNLSKEIDKFAIQLKKDFDFLQIHHFDESFSSQEAKEMAFAMGLKKKARQNKGTIDQLSALIILRDYLESK